MHYIYRLFDIPSAFDHSIGVLQLTKAMFLVR